MLMNTLLEFIAIDDSTESHELIMDHFLKATTASDRVAALTALNRSSASRRRGLLEEVYRKWHPHVSGYANYLRIVGSGTREDVFAMIAEEKERETFDISQPTLCRALFLTMAANTKMVWTDAGIAWVADAVIALAPVNAMTAGRLLNTFQHVHKLKPGLKEAVVLALERVVRELPEQVSPPVHRQAIAYLSPSGSL
jgi:aminopeptidase N